MEKIVENIYKEWQALPPNLAKFDKLLKESKILESDMAYLANLITGDCFMEYDDALNACDEEETKVDYSKLHSTYYLPTLEIMLKNGLNPNALANDGMNLIPDIQWILYKDVSAKAMKMLLEYGADPNIVVEADDGGISVFSNLSFEVGWDENLSYPSLHRNFFQCWIVMIAYGASYPDGTVPLKMLNDLPISIFKEFEHFTYTIEKLPYERGIYVNGNWIMHIFDDRTGEEVAIWD